MKKLSASFEVLLNSEQMKKFKGRTLSVRFKDREFLATLLARFAFIMDGYIDEDMACEDIMDFLEKEKINTETIHKLGLIVKTSRLDEDYDTLH